MQSPIRLGIDLGGSKIEARLLTRDTLLWSHRVPTPGGDYGATIQAIQGLVLLARKETSTFTIGIGTPGSLTPAGLLKNANSTCLNGRPLQRDIEAALGQPVRLSNDANCLALSESVDGAGAGADVVFAAILGTGVGAGIAVRGSVLSGPNGLAGEWGHNPLPWAGPDEQPGPACYCGRQGCIETWLSGPALEADHVRAGGQPLPASEIARHAASGDARCRDSLERHAERMARALASVINLLDPDVIVLGGGLSRMDPLYARVPALWSRWVFAGGQADPVRTRLVPAAHGDASGVRGAAWLWNDTPITSA